MSLDTRFARSGLFMPDIRRDALLPSPKRYNIEYQEFRYEEDEDREQSRSCKQNKVVFAETFDRKKHMKRQRKRNVKADAIVNEGTQLI